MVVAFAIDIQGVNELTTESTSIMTGVLYFGLFLQLVEEQADYQKGPPSFVPRLARAYEFSDDRLELTFHLREGVVWSDGAPVTADDVRFTWEAQTHPAMAWAFIESKDRITDVEVVDPQTVVFHFSEASATQLQDANFGVILPKHAWGQLPFEDWRNSNDWFVDHLVVNGPYTLESWEPQQRFVLRRNERYFEEDIPRVDRIVFQIVPNRNSQLALLRSGQAHLVEFIEPAFASIIEAESRLRLLSHIPRFFYFVQWNVSRPPFGSKKVRQALTMGIDRQAIIDTLYYGYATVSHSLFPSNLWAHNKRLEPWPYDPVQARALLDAEGFEDKDGDGIVEKDGQPFSFELVTNSETPLRHDVVVMIQEQLRRIGVDVRPRVMEFNALLAPLGRHEFDAVYQGIAIDTSLNTSYFFHTNGIEGGYNWGMYSNPEMDTLIDATMEQIDQLAAKPLYDRLQELVHEEVPMTFLYEAQRLSAVDENLHGVDPNAVSSFFHLRRWRFENNGK